MSVNLYRLLSIQSFNGTKIAVYLNEGNYPDSEYISDAIDVVEGNKTFEEVTKNRNYFYGVDVNRKLKLDLMTRRLKISKKVLDRAGNVDKAIFVDDSYPRKWRGERTLYKNESFDLVKSDTPVYTGCKPIGTIII